MATVELLYFDDCPNWVAARAMLDELLAEHTSEQHVALIPIRNETEAVKHRFLGSPSVRVDGRDVEPGAEERRDYGLQCRVYRTAEGLQGTPPETSIRAALGQQS